MRNFVLAIIGAIFILGCSEKEAEKVPTKTPEQVALERCEDTVNAYVIAKEFVRKRLKSPSTSEFPWGTRGPDVSVSYKGDCTHEIYGYVDAQNSYGAKLRMRYYAKVKNELGTDNWRLMDIKMVEP